MSLELIPRWHRLVRELDMRDSGALGEELVARYSEAQRRFHGPAHLIQVLDQLDELNADTRLQLAAWFHDAVYKPGRTDNEQRSARLCRQRLSAAGLSQANIDFVVRAVLATAGHADPDPAFAPLLDADLAILGAHPDAYLAYRQGIRQEFAKIPAFLFQPARARFLRAMLKRPVIYRVPQCRLRFEAQARCNMQHELRQLAEGD